MEYIPLCWWNIKKINRLLPVEHIYPKAHHRARWWSLTTATFNCVLNKISCLRLIVNDTLLNEISLVFIELCVGNVLRNVLCILCIT